LFLSKTKQTSWRERETTFAKMGPMKLAGPFRCCALAAKKKYSVGFQYVTMMKQP